MFSKYARAEASVLGYTLAVASVIEYARADASLLIRVNTRFNTRNTCIT